MDHLAYQIFICTSFSIYQYFRDKLVLHLKNIFCFKILSSFNWIYKTTTSIFSKSSYLSARLMCAIWKPSSLTFIIQRLVSQMSPVCLLTWCGNGCNQYHWWLQMFVQHCSRCNICCTLRSDLLCWCGYSTHAYSEIKRLCSIIICQWAVVATEQCCHRVEWNVEVQICLRCNHVNN